MASGIRMDAPICLIKNTLEGKLEANPEALDILSKIHQPVVVVSIVGMYRTGKSYLMNKLAGARKGFNLGCNVQAETKGIWMWCVPHPKRVKCTLILLDTEGLGDVEKGDTKNDIWIFSLAVLLSSALVYNSKGTIDQDTINRLKFVGELTELIKVKSKDNDDEQAEFSEHFPIFIWAVRDFSLGLVIDGQSVTEDEYLENALKLKKQRSFKDQEYNMPRNYIRMYFGRRKCFVFDQPSADKEVLQRLEEVSESDLKSEFVAQSKKFCDYIFNTAEVKHVIGMPITGDRLAELTKAYTETISTSNIACMEDVVVSLSERENRAAVEEATQYYENKMKERVVFPTETLDQFLELSRQCETEALQIFMKKSCKDEGQKFQKEYIVQVQQRKEDFCKMNETKSKEYCEALIKKHSVEFEEALVEGKYSAPGGHKAFKQALKALKEKYKMETGKGVQADAVLKDYIMSKQSIGANIMKSDELLSEAEKKMEEEKMMKKMEEMESQVRKHNESQRELKKDDHQKTIEENMKRVMEKVTEERRLMRDQLERIIHEKNREMETYYKEKSLEEAAIYQEQIEDLRRKKEEQEEPAWYTPIWESFKALTIKVTPHLFNLAEKKIIATVKSKMEPPKEEKKQTSKPSKSVP